MVRAQGHVFNRFIMFQVTSSREWKPPFAGFVLASLVVLGAVSVARADLTVEKLVANATSGVGPYYQDVADAIREFNAKNYAAAFDHLEKAKKSTPRLAPAEVMMAALYLDANYPAGAVGMLEKAVQRLPQDPEPLVMLGEHALDEGRLTEAEILFARAGKLLESFTENPRRKQDVQLRALSGAASVDERKGNLKEAKAKLEALVKADTRVASAHEKLGRVLFALGEQKPAYAEFQAAAEADKKAMPAELAMAYLSTDKAAAENWLNFAIKKSGSDLRTQVGAAALLLKKNQPEAAKPYAEEALKLDPDGLESNLTAGLIARMMADYKAAETHLGKAHLAAPLHPQIINNLALVLIELPGDERHQAALQYAELGSKLNPNQVEAMTTLGWINYRLNRRREAERAFTAAMNTETGPAKTMTSEMAYYLANLAKEQGNVAEAIKMLKEALNTEAPFAYRKPAEEFLAQLLKLEKTSPKSKSDRPSGSGKSPDPATKAGAAK